MLHSEACQSEEADVCVCRFRLRFKSFIEQYELRELHFHSLMRTKESEVQYSLARLEQQRKLAENETTRSRTLSAQVSTFSQTETELRSQLNIYVEKFKQVRLLIGLFCCAPLPIPPLMYEQYSCTRSRSILTPCFD